MASTRAIDETYLILKYQGWICERDWGPIRKLAHGLYGVVAWSVALVPLVLHLFRIPSALRSCHREAIFSTLLILPAQLILPGFALAFVLLRPKMMEMKKAIQESEEMIFQSSSTGSIQKYQTECGYALSGLRIFLLTCLTFASCWILNSFLTFLLNPTTDYEHLTTALSDFDYGLNKTTYYWYIFAFEAVQVVQLSANYANSHFVAMTFCILINAHFGLFMRSIENTHSPSNNASRPKVNFRRTVRQIIFKKGHLTQKSIHVPLKDDSNSKANILSGRRITFEEECPSHVIRNSQSNELDLRSCIIHHQHVLRLMEKTRSILKPFLFLGVIFTAVIAASCVVLTAMAGRDFMMGIPTGILLLSYFAALLWFLTKLQATMLEMIWNYYLLSRSMAYKSS